jgi:uncharacterized membrane protein YdjX (TVP38/TMEM64 family)
VKRVILFVILLGAVILAGTSGSVASAVRDPAALLHELEEVRETRWVLPLFVVLFGATTGLVPAFVFFVTAGVLWGFWPGVVIGWLAANVWAQVHFLAGRTLGRPLLGRWLDDPRLLGIREELSTGGALVVAVARQLPLPFVGVNAAAGASPMRWTRWTVGNAVGLMPPALVYSWSARAVVAGIEGAKSQAAVWLAIIAVAMGVLGAGARVALRVLKARAIRTSRGAERI